MGDQMFTMKSEVDGRPSVLSDICQRVGQKICGRRRFTISELLCEFPQTSLTLLYEIITKLFMVTAMRTSDPAIKISYPANGTIFY
jgi:hypothetical protein